MEINETILQNGKRVKMDFNKAYIYGPPGAGKGYLTKHKIEDLLSHNKHIFLCDVENDYQFIKSDNIKRILRNKGDSYDVWFENIMKFLGEIPFCEKMDNWFVIDDLNNLDRVQIILETVEEKNLNLIVVSQSKPTNIIKEFFSDNEIFNLSCFR